MTSSNILSRGNDNLNINWNLIKTENNTSKALIVDLCGLDENTTEIHGASHLNDVDYYENYNSFYDLYLLLETIEKMNIPQNIIEEIKNIDGKICILCLGSATTKNITGIAKINAFFRNKKSVDNDEVHIIDINQKSVDIHQLAINNLDTMSDWSKTIEREEAKKHGLIYPKYKISVGDMRKLSNYYLEQSATIIVSDFTFNYLHSIEDIKQTFLEVRKALSPNGIFIFSIEYSKNHLPPNKMEEQTKEGNVKIMRTWFAEYLKAAEVAGLENLVLSDYPSYNSGQATIIFKPKS